MAEHPYNECFEIKTNRLFNLVQRKLVKQFTIAAVYLALSIAIFCFNNDFGFYLLFTAVTGILALIVKVFSYPKFIDITKTTVKFSEKRLLFTLLLHKRVTTEQQYNTTYAIYNIKHIDCSQTPFEKFFNIGHITFYGDLSTDNEAEPARKNTFFTIYGIKNFDKNSKWLLRYIDFSEDETVTQ